jgi:hypothetical protein
MTLLLGSADALADRRLFLKILVLFWLLGAIDGHGKNFSIFLMAGGGYRLTPAYDIMSAYPLLTKRQLDPQKLKMAMRCCKIPRSVIGGSLNQPRTVSKSIDKEHSCSLQECWGSPNLKRE